MENRKIKVLHIIKDDKFYDGVINAFDSDERFENRSILVVNSPDYEFFRIKQTEKVELLWTKKMLKECLQSSNYDVIFFHSLQIDKYNYIKYIPKDKIVIWWSWGFELYSQPYGLKQLIPIDLYKSQTKQLVDSTNKKGIKGRMKDFIKKLFIRPYYECLRRKVISRIDYFQPVIPLEYQLMKKVDGFHAREFYYPRGLTSHKPNTEDVLLPNGGILVGNSTSSNNNHLDVWNIVKTHIDNKRIIVFPLNYGSEILYTDIICNKIMTGNRNVRFLRSFMPRDEYFKLIDNCSYAVFGVMRQQAMGNINYCLRRGIKVFLYRDSLVYRFLKEWGYVVYAIEDVDENSFSKPLTQEELELNAKAFEGERNYVAKIRENAINEIINKIINKIG